MSVLAVIGLSVVGLIIIIGAIRVISSPKKGVGETFMEFMLLDILFDVFIDLFD